MAENVQSISTDLKVFFPPVIQNQCLLTEAWLHNTCKVSVSLEKQKKKKTKLSKSNSKKNFLLTWVLLSALLVF